MTAITLPRITLPALDIQTDLQTLGKQAKALLGYRALDDHMATRAGFMEGVAKLTELGCAPFDAEAVTKYKKVQRRKQVDLKVFAIMGAIFVSIFLFGVFGGLYIHGELALLCIPGFLFGAATIGTYFEAYASWKWEEKDLKTYSQAIPTPVIQKALQIKDAMPKADLYVDSLEYHQFVADPFLVVKYEGNSFHVAVWDEPSFTQ